MQLATTTIRSFLDDVGRRLRRRAATRVALYTLAALVASALLAPLLAAATGAGRGSALGWTFFVGASALGLVGVIAGGLVPRRRWRDRRKVAGYVGGKVPPLASDLLSTVELEAQRERERFSPELLEGLFDHTARRIAEMQTAALVPQRPLRKPAAALCAALLFYVGAAALFPDALSRGWNGLVTAPEPGPFDGAELAREPLVGDVEITLEFPAYAKRAPAKLPAASGDFRAMPGTTAAIETAALEDVAKAQLIFGDPTEAGAKETRDPIPMEVTGRRLSARFTVKEAREYRFLLIGPDGTRRVEAVPHTIEIEADEAPAVELHAPADELDVTAMKRVELAYLAEDDFGIDGIELVWKDEGEARRKALPLSEPGRQTAQGRFFWDLAEVSLRPGSRVAYHLEVSDNDDVLGPNVGKSRTFYLRVFSPRERHQELIGAQRELFEKMVRLLGARLTLAPDDVAAHRTVNRDAAGIVVEIGTILAALEEDELAADDLSEQLREMRERIDRLVAKEKELLAQLGRPGSARKAARLADSDREFVGELEDDVLAFADWIERQQMENLLAISDEIKTHQERLGNLMEEYRRTGSKEILAEIEREMRALEERLKQMREQRAGIPEDVLDRFVNSETMKGPEAQSCLDEVRALLEAGEAEAAAEKMKECSQVLDDSAEAHENALSELRREKFSAEEKKLNDLLNELADLTIDQEEIADQAEELSRRYTEEASELMKQKVESVRREVDETLDRLERQVDRVPEDALTPFSKEELEVVETRIDDVKRMLEDGDISEALSMARQAEAGLGVVESELEGIIRDGDAFARRSRAAHRVVEKAVPLARRLVEQLEKATPSPDEILGKEDRKKLERLRKRQRSVRNQAERLAKRAEKAAGELPGEAGQKMSEAVGRAGETMKGAEKRMQQGDPSGSRQKAREAADELGQAKKQAQGAARMRQQWGRAGLRDEPVRIPGADEYRAPEEFREDILEAMKKEGAPKGFDEMVKRYYEELVR